MSTWGARERLLQIAEDATEAWSTPARTFAGFLTAWEMGIAFTLAYPTAAEELLEVMMNTTSDQKNIHVVLKQLVDDLFLGPPPSALDEVVAVLTARHGETLYGEG